MDDDFTVVQKNPFSVVVAFHTQRAAPLFGQNTLGHLVTNSLQLASVRAGADDEVVSEGGDFTEVKNLDIKRFFCVGGLGRNQPGTRQSWNVLPAWIILQWKNNGRSPHGSYREFTK